MKDYFKSITKTIDHFDTIKEEDIDQILEFHNNQWIAQEEDWTYKQHNSAVKLWNRLLTLATNKFPNKFN